MTPGMRQQAGWLMNVLDERSRLLPFRSIHRAFFALIDVLVRPVRIVKAA